MINLIVLALSCLLDLVDSDTMNSRYSVITRYGAKR